MEPNQNQFIVGISPRIAERKYLFSVAIPVLGVTRQSISQTRSCSPHHTGVTALPYNKHFLDYLRQEYERGRRLILTTASDQRLARMVADYLGIFADVLAIHGKQNLKGDVKCKALQGKFGYRGFDYAGNEAADLKVWANSNAAVVVNAPNSVIRQIETIGRVIGTFARKGSTFSSLIRALRIKHWIKNLLVLVPLITGQELERFGLVIQAVYALAAFNLLASSVYVINDLTDLTNDRQHHKKNVGRSHQESYL